MRKLDDMTERLSPPAIAALGAIVVALPLVGTLAAPALGDAILVAVGGLGGAAAGWLWRRRRALDALPLELSSVAVRGEIDGVPVVKVRARLGRGRVARDPVVRVVHRGADGREVSLPVVLPASVVCGAFTLVAFDRARLTRGPGAVAVSVEVRAGARTWQADRTFASLVEGRFAAPVVRQGGRLAHDRDHWDTVE